MIGEAIRYVRTARQLTQDQLSKQSDVTNSWLSQIELGRKKPGNDALLKIANAMKTTPGTLMKFSERMTTDPKTNFYLYNEMFLEAQ